MKTQKEFMLEGLEELEELGIKLAKKKLSSQVTIKTFMPEEYAKIPTARIHAFVSDIISHQDKMVLDSWMRHFETVKAPYKITEGIKPSIRKRDRIRVQTMWAERKA